MEIPYILKFIYEHSPQFSVLFFGIVMAMTAQQSGSGNSRVSRIELVLKEIEFIKETNKRIEGKLDRVTYDHENRIRTLEHGQGSIKERMKITSGLQAGLALVLSAIAAFIGAQK